MKHKLLLIMFTGSLMGALLLTKSSQPEITSLEVKNLNTKDTVLVYLTLNDIKGFVNDVNGIFGIKSTNKLQGSFRINPNDSVSYSPPKGVGLSGNISFWNPPLNCPEGQTLYEFSLNNYLTVSKAQETVDISCVAGVTDYGSIELKGGGNWTDNVANDSVTSIKNKAMYRNGNISGVFPYGCTNCTNTNGAPDCKDHPNYATPNKTNLCNVQRNAKESGGQVTISYISK